MGMPPREEELTSAAMLGLLYAEAEAGEALLLKEGG
jgi:hypothetical protein